VTDQAQALARQLEASQAQEIDARLTELYLTMEQPALPNTVDLIRHYLIVFVLTGAGAALLSVISFGWRMRRSRPITRAAPSRRFSRTAPTKSRSS